LIQLFLLELKSNTMKEQFVSYELAKKLKDLGFSDTCFAWYYHPKDKFGLRGLFTECKAAKSSPHYVVAPLYQQVLQFLREKYNIHININPQANSVDGSLFTPNGKYSGTLDDVTIGKEMSCSDTICLIPTCNTYQEALIKGIQESIKLIETNKL
jgi:hypothetical protein